MIPRTGQPSDLKLLGDLAILTVPVCGLVALGWAALHLSHLTEGRWQRLRRRLKRLSFPVPVWG